MPSRAKVLIVGGGVAGVEAALALQALASDKVEVELLAPRRDFLYRPLAVGEPFGTAHVARHDLAELAKRGGFTFNACSLKSVEPEKQRAVTHDSVEIDYDFLIVAPGVKLIWSIPGATMFWGGPDELDSEIVVKRLGDEGIQRLVFALPAGRTWSLPLYELAMLTEANLAEQAATGRPQLVIVTPEEKPLAVFGPRVSEAVAGLLAQRGVDLVTGAHPVKFEKGNLSVVPGDPVAADAVIAFPTMQGRRIEGIPHDDDGFVPIDDGGRVQGLSQVYAAGDVTTFPVKQGGIASQQADVIAESIAAELGAEIQPSAFDPVLRGVLWTGRGKKYLYAEITGGHGETSGLTDDPPWADQEGKIVSKYLSPFLAQA
jgi:sulfide:quinone oxidoreductase